MAKRNLDRPYSPHSLAKFLRYLAGEAVSIHDDGDIVTRSETLARLLWDKALGYEEVIVDDEGREKTKKHEPQPWAMQIVLDRLEGKAPLAIVEPEGKAKITDRVNELIKERLNAISTPK
jgi:hypothetical protein